MGTRGADCYAGKERASALNSPRTPDYSDLREHALGDWKTTEKQAMSAIRRLRKLADLIYLCDSDLKEHTPLSVNEPFKAVNNLRNLLKRMNKK